MHLVYYRQGFIQRGLGGEDSPPNLQLLPQSPPTSPPKISRLKIESTQTFFKNKLWVIFAISTQYSINYLEGIPLFPPKRVQAVLNFPGIKMQKPNDTLWLTRERAVRRSLPALHGKHL